MNRSSSRSSSGFTLIELLVVVAIIVLLIAILLPSLGRARDQAKAVLCATNMRQMGQLVNLYAAEHDGDGLSTGPILNACSLGFMRRPLL